MEYALPQVDIEQYGICTTTSGYRAVWNMHYHKWIESSMEYALPQVDREQYGICTTTSGYRAVWNMHYHKWI